MRNGDFSALSRVIDPTTGQPFSGNVIPGNASSVARNILTQLYPEPNTAGSTGAGGQNINNYLINPIKERQDNQFDVKGDHNLTSNNRSSSRYSFQTHRLQPRPCRTVTRARPSAPATATSRGRAWRSTTRRC